MKKIIFFIAVVVTFQCNFIKDPVLTRNSIQGANVFYPLTVGNFWDYTEITYRSDDTLKTEYTARVEDVENIIDVEWSRIVFSPESQISPRYLRVKNDSVFELQYNFNIPVEALKYLKPTGKVQQFQSLLEGDVQIVKTAYILDDPVTTPAGIFDKCYMFVHETPDWIFKEILSDGVGIVRSEFVDRTLEGDTVFIRITELKNYRVR